MKRTQKKSYIVCDLFFAISFYCWIVLTFSFGGSRIFPSAYIHDYAYANRIDTQK